MSGESIAEFLLNALTKNKADTISFSLFLGALRIDYTRGARHWARVISPTEMKKLEFPDEALKVIISRMMEKMNNELSTNIEAEPTKWVRGRCDDWNRRNG